VSRHDAPWGRSLILVSVLATLVSALVSAVSLRAMPGSGIGVWLPGLLPVLVVLLAALWTVRGYLLTDDAVLVQRLLWRTRLPLRGLLAAEVAPDAMRGSIRTLGNGGLFSFSGRFRNRALGSYRAWVTDTRRTVVLRFPERTLVLSPARPADFVREVSRHAVKR